MIAGTSGPLKVTRKESGVIKLIKKEFKGFPTLSEAFLRLLSVKE